MEYWEILDNCSGVAKEREASYGNVVENFRRTVDIHNKAFGQNLTIEDFAKMMISMKLSREQNKHSEDNIIDIINYFAILLHIKNV